MTSGELVKMSCQVQKGDTITKVTDLFKISWKTLRRLNPNALGRSLRNGNWFLKEGVTIKTEESFESQLKISKKNIAKDNWMNYTVKQGDTLWTLAVKKFHVHLKDLINDNGIQDPKKIQPGQKLRIRIPSYPPEQNITASWYGESHHGRPMANGEFFNMYSNTIAHKELPLGTKIELENPITGESAKAIVTDRGPYVPGRDVDVSYGLAKRLSLVEKGVGGLVMRVFG